MSELKNLPIGVQDFAVMRDPEANYTYVDKTKYAYELVTTGKYYFLSRPRRFGKSLFVSTLECLFKGRKDLFRGLWIEDRWDWSRVYPVIKIDFGLIKVEDTRELQDKVSARLQEISVEYQVEIEGSYEEAFIRLITNLRRKFGNGVVILIDEYDKPILDHITNLDLAKEMRDVLRAFYGVIKSMDGDVKFVFMTGISRFSKVGVFSGLNNLNDITMSPRYAGIMGYTQEELETSFSEYIDALAVELGWNREQVLKDTERWYNGYRFSSVPLRVYNPFSILQLFYHRKFANYWFSTGTPSFLVELIEEKGYEIESLDGVEVSPAVFDSFDVETLEITSLLYQTGYLTIKDYNPDLDIYALGYPNYEVERSFVESLSSAFTRKERSKVMPQVYRIKSALEKGDLEKAVEGINWFYEDIPVDVHIRKERYYQSIFYLIMRLLGYYAKVEERTSRGRIDCVVETGEKVYVIEFKLDGTAKQALAQIKEKGYHEKYLKEKEKEVYLVGIAFDGEKRRIGEFVIERVK